MFWRATVGFVDGYLVYASSALAAMGIVAMVLAFVFRFRHNRLEAIAAEGSVPTVFEKTFTVFDPYGEKRTIFHRLLALMAFVPLLGSFGLAILVFVMIGSGLFLALLVVMFGLGLMVVEESSEAYTESKALLRAIESREKLGVGDVKLFQVTRRMLSRLTFYYSGLAVVLIVLAATLPYVWAYALMSFEVVFKYGFEASATLGPLGWILTVGFFTLAIGVVIAVVVFAKNQLFGYRLEDVNA
jgi:hypothetical protein